MNGNRGTVIQTTILFILMLLLVGCGSSGSGGTASDGGESAPPRRRGENVPTMPAAQFTSVGVQSGVTETTTLATPIPEADKGPDLALGERVYANRCAECHGAQAEGGDASALAGLTMPEADFQDLIRTGGDLGPDHLFGTRVVSENGLKAMYAWFQSLGQ